MELRGKDKVKNIAKLTVNNWISLSGYAIQYRDSRFWIQMSYNYFPGYPLIVCGFILIVLGMTIRVFSYKKILVVELQEESEIKTKINIFGYAEKFNAMFISELEDITNDLKKNLPV